MCAQTYGYFDIGEHAWMLFDQIRVDAFARAITKTVKPQHVVADIGTGSGILAALAAKAGARRVFAVERAPIAHVAQKLFEENGVADGIELLRGDAREILFPEPPDVVVSEMVGNFGIEEDILGIFQTLRRRCSSQVQFIPRGLHLSFAPLFEAGLHQELEQLKRMAGGLSMRSFRQRLVNRPVHHRITKAELRGYGAPLWIDLLDRSIIEEMVCGLTLDKGGPVNAIGTWYDLELCEGVSLTTGPHGPPTHWTNIKFPVDPPLEVKAGEELALTLYPKMLPGAGIWSWEVRLGEQVRSGDSMATLMGNPRELLAQLRLRGGRPTLKENPVYLKRMAAALEGEIAPLSTMAQRLLKAHPSAFADIEDAQRQLLTMLDVLGAVE